MALTADIRATIEMMKATAAQPITFPPVHSHLFGFPIVIDPTMPKDAIMLESPAGRRVFITNIGESE